MKNASRKRPEVGAWKQMALNFRANIKVNVAMIAAYLVLGILIVSDRDGTGVIGLIVRVLAVATIAIMVSRVTSQDSKVRLVTGTQAVVPTIIVAAGIVVVTVGIFALAGGLD